MINFSNYLDIIKSNWAHTKYNKNEKKQKQHIIVTKLESLIQTLIMLPMFKKIKDKIEKFGSNL